LQVVREESGYLLMCPLAQAGNRRHQVVVLALAQLLALHTPGLALQAAVMRALDAYAQCLLGMPAAAGGPGRLGKAVPARCVLGHMCWGTCHGQRLL
jgi:hypothetical protein